MDPMTAIAASGLRARMESLDLLANNVANASTGGYKADREFYSLYVAPEAAGNEPLSTMPLIERPWVDHSQGVLHNTGNAARYRDFRQRLLRRQWTLRSFIHAQRELPSRRRR